MIVHIIRVIFVYYHLYFFFMFRRCLLWSFLKKEIMFEMFCWFSGRTIEKNETIAYVLKSFVSSVRRFLFFVECMLLQR